MLRRRHAAVPLVLSLFLLVGCSDDGSDEADTSNGSDTTATASPEAGEATDTPDAEDPEETGDDAADVPDGMQLVDAAGIQFALPAGWTVLDPAEVAEGSGDNQAVQEMADRIGATPEQFEQMLSSLDLYAVTDQGARGGFLDNVNVVAADGPLPNDSQIRQQYLAVGADVDSLERSDDGTETVRVAGTMEVQGNSHALEALAVGQDDQYVVVTVSAGQADTARELMDGIAETLTTSDGQQG